LGANITAAVFIHCHRQSYDRVYSQPLCPLTQHPRGAFASI